MDKKFNCPRCGYNTNHFVTYKRHITRKLLCKNILSDDNLEGEYLKYNIEDKIKDFKMVSNEGKNTQNIPNFLFTSPKHPQNIPQKRLTENTECEYCKKKLSSYKNLRRHLKTCKEKQKDDTVRESMEELVMLLNEKLEKKDKQIEELVKKAGLVNMTNSHNNITNNIQNNIKLLNYKETDTSHLTENDYVRCLEHYNFCVPHIIRKIHFNPKKPENHNIYISNLKNSYVMIYMNNKWKVKNRDETISRLIDDKQILLEKKINEWVESGIQYPRIMAKFSRYLEKREENDVINAIKEDIKLMLYNNRNMIVENNKRIKLQKY